MKQELTTAAWVQASALNDPLTTHLPAWKHNYTHLEDTPLVLLADAQAMLDAKDAEIAALKSTIEAERDLNQRLRVLPFSGHRVNGVRVQTVDLSTLVRDAASLLSDVSAFMTLQPGDLILTGTPDGVVDCKHGDVIVTEIERIGALMNTIEER